MSSIQEPQILLWVEEESENLKTKGKQTIVPIQILMLRMVLVSRQDDEKLTQSTELSLNAYDRANLFRLLRQLERKRFIQFVDESGWEPKPAEGAQTDPTHLMLTDGGALEVKRLKRIQTGV